MRSNAREIAIGIVFGWVGIQLISFAFGIVISLLEFWITSSVVVK
jgi:hypothetical protein